VYYRLHGSSRVYYSPYPPSYLKARAARLAGLTGSAQAWCVFDKTALGEATTNALSLLRLLGRAGRRQ
jgi:uncharacterized protein YecE (DUF72 family)